MFRVERVEWYSGRRGHHVVAAAHGEVARRARDQTTSGEPATCVDDRLAGLGMVERIPALKQMFIREAAGFTGDVPKLLRGEMV